MQYNDKVQELNLHAVKLTNQHFTLYLCARFAKHMKNVNEFNNNNNLKHEFKKKKRVSVHINVFYS